MSIIQAPLMYLAIFIGFLAAFHFINKMNQGVIDKSVAKMETENRMPDLAKMMGLHYKSLSEEGKTNKTIMNTGDNISGEYQGLPIDITFTMNSSHAEHIPAPYTHGYTYAATRRVTITVKNPEGRKFHIMPKNKHVVAKPTGNSAFDKNMTVDGDEQIPSEFLDYCSQIGWVDIKLEGNKLTYNDNYMDQFSSAGKAMQAFKAVHPIFKTSAQNFSIDIDSFKNFIDRLINLAKTWN